MIMLHQKKIRKIDKINILKNENPVIPGLPHTGIYFPGDFLFIMYKNIKNSRKNNIKIKNVPSKI